jgi:glucose-1-phosphate thymidylyltransferase
MLPLTKITNKHLLPVFNRPMIYYPIQCLLEAGIDEIMLVTGGSFAGDFLQLLGNGRDFGLREIRYAYQQGEGGIADALRLAEHFVDDDRCVVVLGDNIFENSIAPAVDAFRKQEAGARILLKEVPDPERFGVPTFDGDRRITRIDEKPSNPASHYSVTGVYMYDAQVWKILPDLKPSGRGELEITDVNNAYLRLSQLEYDIIEGWWTDAGTFESLLRASQLVAEAERKKTAPLGA